MADEKSGGGDGKGPNLRLVTTAARARGDVPSRVSHIVGMMERGQWEKGVSGPALAEQWGCSVSVVKDYATEASRRIRALVDRDGVRARVAGSLDRALDMAEEQGDAKAVAMVAKAYSGLVGADAPTRIEVSSNHPTWLPPELAPLIEYLPADLESPPTADEWRHLAAELTPERCTLTTCRMHPRRG